MVAIAAAAGVLAGAAAAWRAGGKAESAIEWLEVPRPLPAFTLHTDAGELGREHLTGRWTVMLFGYTRCPDVCPASLAALAATRRAGAGARVGWLFVSVDPADTPAAVGAYARAFHGDFVGATGSPADLGGLGESLGIAYSVSAGGVAHSTAILLIGPEAALMARLRPGAGGRDLAGALGAAVAAMPVASAAVPTGPEAPAR